MSYDKIIRIKMICNWCNSKELCYEWSNMCEKGLLWQNIEITWEDDNIDYYIIINYPQNKDNFYIPKKTIIFQMEPWVAVKTWGEWSYPDESKFMFVASHKNHLNAVQLQIRTIPVIFPQRYDNILSILSSKNHDDGHKKRINFIKHLESRNIDLIHVYGRENYHKIKNYKGCVIDDSKEKCFEKYKYTFQSENNMEYNYATEKIWESICCECLCFYWGCPNLEEYIDSRCFIRLDLNDINNSINTIQQAIREDWWSQRIDIIRKEKDKILNKLGFFPTIKKIISKDSSIYHSNNDKYYLNFP